MERRRRRWQTCGPAHGGGCGDGMAASGGLLHDKVQKLTCSDSSCDWTVWRIGRDNCCSPCTIACGAGPSCSPASPCSSSSSWASSSPADRQRNELGMMMMRMMTLEVYVAHLAQLPAVLGPPAPGAPAAPWPHRTPRAPGHRPLLQTDREMNSVL